MKKENKKLLNGCTRSSVFVSPKNYKSLTKKSSFKKDWFVQCRFYDPVYEAAYPDGFQYRKKFSSDNLEELKLTAEIFKDEMELTLDTKNYNPITKTYMTERKTSFHPYMPFVKALENAHKKLEPSWSKNHAKEVKRCIGHVDKIKESLNFSDLLINEVRTWHVKTILDELELTDSVFNKSRSYLQSCFKILTEYGCCENNPADNITKRIEVKKIREVITEEKLHFVRKYLKEKCYSFYRYGRIFFYSAGRTAELFRVQKKHVDLKKQEYEVLIKKGKQYTWVKKIIIPAAIPYWREILALCEDEEEFLFSKGLIPGEKSISPKQISIRWNRHVKKSKMIKDSEGNIIRITEDFYSQKHLFLDILDEMNSQPVIPIQQIAGPAQRMANHTTENTTNIYTKKRVRKNEDLKRLMVD